MRWDSRRLRIRMSIALVTLLATGGSAAAGTAPTTAHQANKVVEALLAKETNPCALTWTRVAAQGLTMQGPPWRVTVTLKTKKGSGEAIWMLQNGATTPSNALATAVSRGCH